MNNSKHFTFKIPIYDEIIHIYFAKTIKSGIINNNLSKDLVEDADRGEFDNSIGMVTAVKYGNTIRAVVLFKNDVKRNTILHEISHLTFMILRWKSIQYNTKEITNEEPFAYLFGYIGDKLFDICEKRNS